MHTGPRLNIHHCADTTTTRSPSLISWLSMWASCCIRVSRIQFKACSSERQLIIHMSPDSGSCGNRNNLHHHQAVTYLGFPQTKYRASHWPDRYRPAALSVPKRRAIAHVSQVHYQYDSARVIIAPGWSRCTCCWSLAPRSFAEHFLTFSGSLDDPALLPLLSLQRTTGVTTGILCLFVSLVFLHGPLTKRRGPPASGSTASSRVQSRSASMHTGLLGRFRAGCRG